MHLKELRKNANKTQAEVADNCGITLRSYQNYESNNREMGYSALVKVADFFGVSVDYLLGHETPNILHLDGLTVSQKRLIDLAQKLDDNQANYIAGRISELLGLSYEQARPTRPF